MLMEYVKLTQCMLSIRLWACCVGLIFFQTSYSVVKEDDAQKYPWVYYLNIEEGLPSNWVTSITQDDYGIMWFGTWNGIASWDGKHLKTFKKEGENSVLRSNMVTDIKKAPDGNIYICTAASFVYVYDIVNEELKRLEIANDTILYNETAQNIHFNNYGIWIGTNFGLVKYDNQTHTTRIFQNKNFLQQNKNQRIFAMTDGFGDELWIGTENGIQYFDQNKQRFVEVDAMNVKHFNIDFQVNCFYTDEFGRIWLGTSKGLFFYDQSTREFHHIKNDNIESETPMNLEINDIYGDHNGNLFIGTTSRLLMFNFKQATFFNLTHDVTQKHAINSYYIHSVYCNTNGVVWVGTYNGGVNYFKPSHKGIEHINSQQEGLCSPYVLDINEDKLGNIWIGTENGLTKFSQGLKDTKTFLVNNEPELSSRNFVIRNVVIDSYNEVWLTVYGMGLAKLNRENGELDKTINLQDIEGNGKKKNNNSLIEIEPGILCFDYGDHVKLFDTKTNFIYDLIDYYNLPHEGFKNVQSVFKKPGDHKILVVTNQTVFLIDLKNDTLKTILKDYDLGFIYTALTDSRGNVWLGSPKGISMITKDGIKSKIDFEGLNLSSSSVLNIIEDDHGNIWFTTANELVKIPSSQVGRSTIDFQDYNTVDGLQNGEFKEGACLITSSGMIILGGNDGLNYFDPKEFVVDTEPPEILFTDLYVHNELQKPGKKGSVLSQSIKNTKTVKLYHKRNNIKISFTSLNYILSGKNKFAYIMEGFDANWIYSGTRAQASYSLPVGKYRFRVKASNNWGVWNEEGILLNIEVLPPWWNSFWFYLTVLSFITVALYIFYRIKTRNIKLRNQELENKIHEKTSDLLKLNEELQHRNKEVTEQKERVESLAKKLNDSNEQKIKLFTSISHEFRTPLALIIDPVESLLKVDAYSDHKRQLQLINKNATRLQGLVEQIIDLRKIDQKVMKLTIIDYKLQDLLEEVIALFSEEGSKNGIKIVFIFSGHHPKTYIDKSKIENIIINLISNAIKHTQPGGVISLFLNFERQGVKTFAHITVQDTGEGIPEKDIPFIFDRFYTSDKAHQGIGIGLSFCKELIKIHNGSISVSSKEGEGSKFSIELPVSANCYEVIEDDPDKKFTQTRRLSADVFNNDPEIKNEAFENLKINAIRDNSLPILLIVEDHKDLREIVISKLYPTGNVYEAGDGLTGLQLAQAILPDLIISDILMPGLDGITLCERIKSDKLTSHIPVILLTAKTGDEQQLEGLMKGADDYLVKPFNMEILVQKVNNILRLREKMKEQYSSSYGISVEEIVESSSDQKYLKYLTRIIDENMSDSLFSVESLGVILNLDRFQVYRKIHAVTGLSPSKFITRVRLTKALELLKSKKVNVSEVAYHVGFNSSSYFARCFKEVYGVQPSKYHELLKNRRIN